MVKFYSVSDSKSGIQFGFKLNFDPNLDLNETILDLHSSGGLQTRNTHIDTQREKCWEGRRLIGKTEIYVPIQTKRRTASIDRELMRVEILVDLSNTCAT